MQAQGPYRPRRGELRRRLRALHGALPAVVASGHWKLDREAAGILQKQGAHLGLPLVAADMCRWMGLDLKARMRIFRFQPGGRPGRLCPASITHHPEGTVIEIGLGPPFRAVHILATLAHELCHALHARHGLREPDDPGYEWFTDLTAVYLGFGPLLQRAYKPMAFRRANGKTGLLRLGYLDRDDLQAASCESALLRADLLLAPAMTPPEAWYFRRRFRRMHGALPS